MSIAPEIFPAGGTAASVAGSPLVSYAADCEYLDLENTNDGRCGELRSPRARTYGFGMALWVGARLGTEPPGWLIDRVDTLLADPHALLRSSAQGVGMLLCGATALALQEGGQWRAAAETLAAHLREHYCDPVSRWFHNQSVGYRRRFASFASQVYSILALYQFGGAFAAELAVDPSP